MKLLSQNEYERIFTDIYQTFGWNGVGSGLGSLPISTTLYRRTLREILHGCRVKKVVDLGCGDWQFSRLIDWTGVEYLGLDIVAELVVSNTARYSGDNIRFEHADIRSFSMPKADLYLIKDVLQHWPTSQIQRLLQNMAGQRMLITNTVRHRQVPVNSDIRVGSFRPLDLRAHPFDVHGVRVVLEYANALCDDYKQVLLVEKPV